MSRTDARIRYTQGVLKQALLSFLQEKPINKITVKEVCERAELNRATFYARGKSIAYWKQHLHRVTEAELEMLYTHLSNGLMHVVVEGYEEYSREEVVRFVNRIVQCSLSQFQ